jgi:toxin ParE1/3/4
MKNEFKVFWTDAAENDLWGIIGYIALDNKITARKVLGKIRKKVSLLFSTPKRGRVVPELLEHGLTEYRELIFSPWRIIYKIEKQKVIVLSVLDSRRNLEDILYQRLISKNF